MTPASSTTPGSGAVGRGDQLVTRQKDGYQQRSKSASFPQGTSWHDVQLDNQQYIDHALPGRIEHRGREVVKVMLPLVKELAKVEKKS